MLYTFSMKVLIPHKDVIFYLTKIQQKFIFDFNNFSLEASKNTKASLIPLFPLWAFFDNSDFEDFKNLCKSQIEKIDFDLENNKFYFSIKFDFHDLENFTDLENSADKANLADEKKSFSKTLKIYFAQKLKTQNQNFSLKEFTKKFNADFFPIKMNVFKFGNVLEKNSSWKVFDEKWIKISSK